MSETTNNGIPKENNPKEGNPKERNLNSSELGLKNVLDEVISVAGDSTPGAGEKTASKTQTQEDLEKARRDEALFVSLQKKKKKKRRKVIRTVIIVILLVLVLGFAGVLYLRKKVTVSMLEDAGDVLSYEAKKGSISTTISGSGTLANVEEEYVTVPEEVEIEEVLVEANDKVTEGDKIAELNMPSVRTAISTIQDEITAIDEEIYAAAGDKVDDCVASGVTGRIKIIYAQKGDKVTDVMYEHSALAVLSLDGYMAFEVAADGIYTGDKVSVTSGDGSGEVLEGTVESVVAGTAVILVTDDGPMTDELVTATDASGRTLGQGKLYIHKPLRITGIAGTVTEVYAIENHRVGCGDTLFVLTDTSFTAEYETLLREREELEDTLLELMQLNHDGTLLAPFSGSVASVLYDDGTSSTADTSSSSSSSYSSMYSTASTTTTASASSSEEGVTDIITLSPDKQMEVSISVDESNIMSLEVGQTATVTISSISDDSFNGVVSEINKTASSSSGVTRYSAVITLNKDEQMLSGMTAKVVVSIQGVDDAIIIPVDALHQTSTTSYVYTTYDEEMQQYGGMKEVEVGISNSSYVEIISGLEEGDTVYYVESEDDPFANMSFGGMGGGDFGGGGMGGGGFGGGGMPGGR